MHSLLAFGAACVSGAINSVAGGGSLVSFPALIWLGLPSVVANATNTAATWPGSMASVWGYRRELRGVDRRVYGLVIPSIVGGIIGALLLRLTPTPMFDRLVPLLILFATGLFMAQDRLQRRFIRISLYDHTGPRWLTEAMLFQLAVAVYGGYFGAGMGILMLAALAVMGHSDIHQMNGLKNLLAVCINLVATFYFAWANLVYWPDALVMTAGFILGGFGGASLARRAGQKAVRRTVVVIGFAMALALMFRV